MDCLQITIEFIKEVLQRWKDLYFARGPDMVREVAGNGTINVSGMLNVEPWQDNLSDFILVAGPFWRKENDYIERVRRGDEPWQLYLFPGIAELREAVAIKFLNEKNKDKNILDLEEFLAESVFPRIFHTTYYEKSSKILITSDLQKIRSLTKVHLEGHGFYLTIQEAVDDE